MFSRNNLLSAVTLFVLIFSTQTNASLYESTQRFFGKLREKFSQLFVTRDVRTSNQTQPNQLTHNNSNNDLTQEERDLKIAVQESKITAAQEEQRRANARAQQIKDDSNATRKLQQETEDIALALQLQEKEDAALAYTLHQEGMRNKQIESDEALARRLQEQEIAPSALPQESQQEVPAQSQPAYTSKTDLFGLPPKLQGKAIYHLKALQQKGGTSCGYHTTFNALAIERMVTAQKTPTTQEIQSATSELLKIDGLSFGREEDWKMLELGSEQERFNKIKKILHNTYFIKYNTYNSDDVIYPAETSNNNQLGLMYDALPKIKNSKVPLTVHLPLLLGDAYRGHWVYIGVVKEAKKKPYIIYLDSCNSPIPPNSPQEKVLNRIYELIQ